MPQPFHGGGIKMKNISLKLVIIKYMYRSISVLISSLTFSSTYMYRLASSYDKKNNTTIFFPLTIKQIREEKCTIIGNTKYMFSIDIVLIVLISIQTWNCGICGPKKKSNRKLYKIFHLCICTDVHTCTCI